METGFDVVASSSEVNGCQENRKKPAINLPPGFRFHPTDEEIIGYYLVKKVADGRFCAIAIGEADFNKCEPWDLPKMAKMGEKEWFFFSHRDRKYPTGIRTNRATRAGYWKATGKDKEVYKGRNNLVGMKKTLVFYLGRAPKGEKTNWVLHEYRIEGDVLISNRTYSSEEWAVCKVFHKNVEITRNVDLPGNVTIVDRHMANHITLPPVTNIGVAANDGHLASSSAFPPVTNTGFAANDYHNDGSKEKFASPPDILLGDPNNLIASFQNIGHVTMDNPFLNTTNFGQGNPISFPNEIFPSPAPPFASHLGYQQDNGQSSMVFNNHCNVVPFNGVDQETVGMMPPNIELFSSNNSAVSRSQDTGLGAENIVNDISSVPSIEQNSSTMAQDLEGFNFINSLLDLDFLWSK